MLRITGGILGIRDAGKEEEEDGGWGGGWGKRRTACFALGGWGVVVVGTRLPPLYSHAIEWARHWVRLIMALHHAIDKVQKPSLDSIRHHNPATNYLPIIISSVCFFYLLFLSSSQSTISLRLLPPYAPGNETSIFIASYRSYRVWSPDPKFPPHRLKTRVFGAVRFLMR